ncbi:polysaccharide deacetylase [Lampropedia puyangensis]|uniref:Polysaccharide deacetylase n=2 Tax=Lampropedia puyangensis TaxID=1330072 RepID=A0A4S8ETN1_9BURK|nr:polysaccharide deacetylase [Lampropedia puyangensis]
MGNPLAGGLFDTNADGYGRYGAQAGIQRLMRTLEGTGVRASVFVSGALAETDPQQVRAVAAAGHEIVGHGFAQDLIPASLTDAADLDSIRRSTEALQQVAGQRPLGWISPRASPGPRTLPHLIAQGYQWHADALDADRPYLQRTAEGQILAIPLAVEFNDLAHAMRFGRTPQQFVDMFTETLPHLLAAKDDVVILDVMVHTHCYGRPACAWAFGEIARLCSDRQDIWVATRGDIAAHVFKSINA